MSTTILAAAVQMTSTADKQENLDQAAHWVELAAKQGAQLVVLPELFNCQASREVMLANSEPVPGPTSDLANSWAKRWGITLVAGSILETAADGKGFNTSLTFDPDGNLKSVYRKLHLFDVDLPGEVTFKESDFVEPGSRIEVAETPCGRIGMSICYDLRFPELYRRLADRGADIITVPSAFALATGRDHWEVLLRARAIENQAYVVAANQYGPLSAELVTYGRSMIIDPWGIPLAVAADGPGVTMAAIDLDRAKSIRQRLPALQHRRQLESWED